MVLNVATGNVITHYATWFKSRNDKFMMMMIQHQISLLPVRHKRDAQCFAKETILHIHMVRSVDVCHPLSYSALPEYRHSHLICN